MSQKITAKRLGIIAAATGVAVILLAWVALLGWLAVILGESAWALLAAGAPSPIILG